MLPEIFANKIIKAAGLILLYLNTSFAFGTEADEDSKYKFMHLSINEGLSNNLVRAILKDSRGFMWFGTGNGLNRFDETNFKVYRHNLNDSTSIPFNSIDFLFEDVDRNIWIRSLDEFAIYDPEKESFTSAGLYYKNTPIPLFSLSTLYKDHSGNMWFVDASRGLYSYNPVSGAVDSLKRVPSSGDSLSGMGEDSHGNIWVVTDSGVVEKIDRKSQSVLSRAVLTRPSEAGTAGFNIFVDSADRVWVYVPGRPHGAYMITSASGKIVHYTDSSEPVRLSSNLVSSVVQDEKGKIWLATDHGGVNILDIENGSIHYLVNNPDNHYSLGQNSVNYLYRDSEDIIWAGTYKRGVSYYHENLIRFEHFRNLPSVDTSLPFNDVNCFVEDRPGNLWIGTNGGGLIYFDRENNTFKTFRNDPGNPESLSSNIIVSLFMGRDGQLWIGSYFGGLDRYDGKVFHHHRHNPENPLSLSDDRVWEIFEDSRRNLWIGTLKGGLNLYDREKDVFYHYRANETNSVGSDFIMSIIEDSKSNLWLCTPNGLDRLDLVTGRFYHYPAGPGQTGRLSDRNAVDIHEDSHGYIWIGTSEGLNVFDRNAEKFRVITEADGLADSDIKTILEDQEGNLWIGTANGLSRIEIVNAGENPTLDDLKLHIVNFDMADGLQGKEFNEKAAYRTRSGELIFGGANGFNLFIPEQIRESRTNDKVVLTNLRVFNRTVPVGMPFRNRVILEKSITSQNEIKLRHRENVFSFEFAALDFLNPPKNRFEYRLEGFNDEWLKADNRTREATFTNLNAGEYFLHIRVKGDNDNWAEMQPPLKITIMPPFVKSNFATVMYLIAAIGILLTARKIILEWQRLRFEAEQEHREAEQARQLDTFKTSFFTNMSHEFRTPLTLILGPVERLMMQIRDEKLKNQLALVHRNARRLQAMVNQLLDFRKMEDRKIEVRENWGNIISFVGEVAFSFQDMADNKHIFFSVNHTMGQLYTFFDRDKFDKIMSNLLSNAFKFTPEKGEITVNMEMIDGSVKITVSDTGIGIPHDKLGRIFDRFYQNDLPPAFVNQGTGIGLSMVGEYVSLLRGTVNVESMVGKGSIFTVTIPVKIFSAEEIKLNNTTYPEEKIIPLHKENKLSEPEEAAYDKSKPLILIVDDNDDFRFYLKDNLKRKYNIVEEGNGRKGWEMTLKHLPDLIVSDIVMPLVDGLEFCSKVKNDGRTSHIPVILLTARVEPESTLEGYRSGADDYISKPFDFRILESRIENLIRTREQLRLTYQAMIGINPEKIEIHSLDEKLIKKALQIVEKNISDADFSVEDLSRELGMSRVSFYKKLLSLTKTTPVEFIRIIRLKRAAYLMENSQHLVSEIAYMVGFNSPRYFSRYFKEFFTEHPSEYIAKHRRKIISQ